MSAPGAGASDRLVLFEVGGGAYALPITHVLEVGELGRPAGIPTLPRRVASVANHHGDALPILARGALFDGAPEGFPDPTHVLVLGGRSGEAGRLGLPVDRVIGIVAGAPGGPGGSGIVSERREVQGRVVGILDAERLFEAAARAIEQACEGGGVPGGGEP